MNKAQIVRDDNLDVYLKVTGKPLTEPAYFKIQSFTVKDKIEKEINLSKVFNINLSGKK